MNTPEKYVDNWETRGASYKKGIVDYWAKEVKNFDNQIRKAEEELDRRKKK